MIAKIPSIPPEPSILKHSLTSQDMTIPNHLVIVCCHAIWTGGPSLGQNESEWLIAAFQAGETPTFISHIKAGISCLADDHQAVLIFSGSDFLPVALYTLKLKPYLEN
jgi:hypothetical protein